MTLLIIYLVIAIGVSFLCSILEAVLLSVSHGFVESQLVRRPRRAQALKRVKDNLDESISSILILNTFAHTMGAAGVGAQAVYIFGAKWESLIAFLLTLAILYLSEIIPKTLGATFWKQLAIPASFVIALLVKILFPFVWLSARLTRLFAANSTSKISRDELAAMAKLGKKHGTLGTQESELLENILLLREKKTRDILTPRSVIAALESPCSVKDAIAQVSDIPFTRIPVFEENLDRIFGIVFKNQLLAAEDDKDLLENHVVPVHRVSGELPVLTLLDTFIKRREHLFLVEDEYGQTAGVVTLEDALETLLGREIMDESDTVEDMQQLAKRRYRERLQQAAKQGDAPGT